MTGLPRRATGTQPQWHPGPLRRAVPAMARRHAGRHDRPARPAPWTTAWRRERALRTWYLDAGLPLFGLPADWTGYRCPGQRAGRQAVRRAGPFGLVARPSGPLQQAALGLTHIAGDGGLLHVGSHRLTSYPVHEAMAAGNFFRRLALPLLAEAGREAFDRAVTGWRRRFRSGELSWRPLVIPVDARAVEFRALTVGSQWVATAMVGGVCLQLDAQQFPAGRVRLVRIADPRPYLPESRI